MNIVILVCYTDTELQFIVHCYFTTDNGKDKPGYVDDMMVDWRSFVVIGNRKDDSYLQNKNPPIGRVFCFAHISHSIEAVCVSTIKTLIYFPLIAAYIAFALAGSPATPIRTGIWR